MVITKCNFCGREIDTYNENFISILPRIGDYTKSAEIIELVEKLQDICPDCMRRIVDFSKTYRENNS